MDMMLYVMDLEAVVLLVTVHQQVLVAQVVMELLL
jgi:hypothetical protein